MIINGLDPLHQEGTAPEESATPSDMTMTTGGTVKHFDGHMHVNKRNKKKNKPRAHVEAAFDQDVRTGHETAFANLDHRRTTPPQTMRGDEGQGYAGSLDDQSQENPQAARQETVPLSPARPLTPMPRVHGRLSSEGPRPEPLSPAGSQPARSQTHYSNRDDPNVERAVHRVSDQQHQPARVVKRKSRPRKATALAQSDGSFPTIDDYFQVFRYKLYEREESVSGKFGAKLKSLQVELQGALDRNRILQEELNHVLQQKDALAITADKQRARVDLCESTVKKFKTFVDGLGNDFDTLKREAKAARQMSEQFIKEGDCKTEREALFNQLQACAEKSAQLKDQALKAYQEAQLDVQAAVLRANYLDQQLSEKVGLLAEERDRRSQLERQLAAVPVPQSDDATMHTLRDNSDAILDKLYEIHSAVEDQSSKEVSDMLEKTFAGVQALNSQAAATVDDVASVRSLIETLSEK